MPEMKVEVSPRAAASAARLKLIADAVTRPSTVKVYPASEDMRRVLRHPNGPSFRADANAGADWPNDSFTTRRIADGSVRTDGPASGKPPPDDPKLSLRERAAARAPKPEAKPAEGKGKS